MNTHPMMSTTKHRPNTLWGSTAAALAAFALAGPLSADTILQWGFDSTTGAVAVPIADDSGANHPATALLGNGGVTYSADIPSAAKIQNVTGIGSVNFGSASTAAIATPQYTPPATPADIWAAGGLTMEVWVKNPVQAGQYDGFALSFGDMYNLSIYNGRIGFHTAWGYGIDTDQYVAGEWNHLAAVLVPAAADCLSYHISAYLNGKLINSESAILPQFLYRATLVGNGTSAAGYNNYAGLVYEPRISLGALTPGEFTVVPATGDLSTLDTVSGVTTGGPIALTVKVNNAGTTAYQVSAPDFTGTNAANFSAASNTFPLEIPAGGSADVLVDFTPAAGGTAAAILTLTTDDPNKATLTVQLSVEVHDPEISIASTFNLG